MAGLLMLTAAAVLWFLTSRLHTSQSLLDSVHLFLRLRVVAIDPQNFLTNEKYVGPIKSLQNPFGYLIQVTTSTA